MGAGSVVGLFAGIGGLEHGLHDHGWNTELFCEIDAAAQAVLTHHFPDVPVVSDVTKLRGLPQNTEMVTAGFPCQDLSQAGRTVGIHGERSGLVEHVFRLVRRKKGPRWLLIENVPFMLQLDRGWAMRHLTSSLEEHGYSWAYRIVDARAFGRPQRRWRVLLLASRTEDPREVLFGQDATEPFTGHHDQRACGFYWTEGTRGLGWAVDATPTLKGGSAIGIASPPAVRLTGSRGLVTPGIADAEWLQGFARDWTRPALDVDGVRPGHRWKLVGNAVSALMSAWIGERLANPVPYDGQNDQALQPGDPWPRAAWGRDGNAHRADLSMWPVVSDYHHLEESLLDPAPLSVRATQGFLKRARASKLKFVPGFLDDVEKHLINMGGDPREAA
ncbi:MAG: DNA (cytosine-5-)-methyltransferase [Actinophytocola sp.]|uniref:DNA cytosine methyltransferase n=1 Tax=Actinophytocola sp. TaxID=1872138 RepID=UPI0013226AC9|nr:DNA (cytosine-5-)-methyltransferase [Actinophytocola sp.]MPZ84012.1 DNA (cytosine-5-)-methyltransferase [Actinophytocola sp.]